ncbi:MAG: DUF1049 domain-containing protein [Zetaproteobacteria bacterium]|nr:DUF1049 domain-containing protein [Zetaproteobacteria bacterium]
MKIFIVNLVIFLLLVIFGSQNIGLVNVYWVFGPPVTMPLIAVIGVGFAAGVLFAMFFMIRRALNKNKSQFDR